MLLSARRWWPLAAATLLLFSSTALGKPRRTRAEKIQDNVYSSGVKQRQRALDRSNQRRWQNPIPGHRSKRGSSVIPLPPRCRALRHMALQSVWKNPHIALNNPPPGSSSLLWNGMTYAGKIRWYGTNCYLNRKQINALLALVSRRRTSSRSSSRTKSNPFAEHNRKAEAWERRQELLKAQRRAREQRRADNRKKYLEKKRQAEANQPPWKQIAIHEMFRKYMQKDVVPTEVVYRRPKPPLRGPRRRQLEKLLPEATPGLELKLFLGVPWSSSSTAIGLSALKRKRDLDGFYLELHKGGEVAYRRLVKYECKPYRYLRNLSQKARDRRRSRACTGNLKLRTVTDRYYCKPGVRNVCWEIYWSYAKRGSRGKRHFVKTKWDFGPDGVSNF